MGISIPSSRLKLTLEKAMLLAESDAELPELWRQRVERIAESPAKTYVAALGTALLAKAADDRIDALTIKAKAGPNGYSMRGVVKVLAERAPHYGYHLGVTGPEPLNNQPWFGSTRIDRFANLRADVVPYQRDMVRYLSDLNRLSSDEALIGLATFLRLRLGYAREHQIQAESLTAPGTGSFGELLELIEIFINSDPEGGRRGQALVAALLDLSHDDVRLASINDPTSLDVSVRRGKKVILAVEVKQKAVDAATADHLAKEAAERGADKALLAAIAADQGPLDRETIRQSADQDYGVLALAYDSLSELVSQIALHSKLSAAEFAEQLPSAYLRRMQEHGVSTEGQQHWVDLCAGLSR